jgi:hypothetical protein
MLKDNQSNYMTNIVLVSRGRRGVPAGELTRGE